MEKKEGGYYPSFSSKERIVNVLKLIKEAVKTLVSDISENVEVEEKLDEQISYLINDVSSRILNDLDGCASPIEKLFAIHFHKLMDQSFLNHRFDILDVQNQALIVCDDKEFVVDFLVSVLKQENDISHYFVIECDGHEFHEKTKEQVKKDRKRERELLKNGYVVIRFTGSEIYEKSYQCALEAKYIIESFIKNYLFQGSGKRVRG